MDQSALGTSEQHNTNMPYLSGPELVHRVPEHLFIRDFQERITPNETQRNTLIVAGIYIVAIAIEIRAPLVTAGPRFLKHPVI